MRKSLYNYEDNIVIAGKAYSWRLGQLGYDGALSRVDELTDRHRAGFESRNLRQSCRTRTMAVPLASTQKVGVRLPRSAPSRFHRRTVATSPYGQRWCDGEARYKYRRRHAPDRPTARTVGCKGERYSALRGGGASEKGCKTPAEPDECVFDSRSGDQ